MYFHCKFLFLFREGDVGGELFGGQPVPDIGGQIRGAVEDPTEARVLANGAIGQQQHQQQQQRQQRRSEQGHIAARGTADVWPVLVV